MARRAVPTSRRNSSTARLHRFARNDGEESGKSPTNPFVALSLRKLRRALRAARGFHWDRHRAKWTVFCRWQFARLRALESAQKTHEQKHGKTDNQKIDHRVDERADIQSHRVAFCICD